jgi:flagellar hook-associated protein 1 FlgK
VGNFANYDKDVDEYNVVLSGLTDAKGRSWSETTTVSAAEFDAAVKEYNGSNATGPAAKSSGAAQEGDTFQIEEKDGTISTYTVVKDSEKTRANNGTTVLGYTKTVTSRAYMLEDNDLYGSLQSYRELLTEAGEYSTAQMRSVDSDATTKRGIPYYLKALDSLANQLASKFNELNMNYKTDADGNYLDTSGNKVQSGTDADGNAVYLNQSMTQKEVDDFLKNNPNVTLDTVGDVAVSDAGVLFSNSGTGNDATGITAANISISQSWANGEVHIVNSFTETVAGQGVPSTASDNIDRFVGSFSEKLDYFAHTGDTNPMFSGTFQEMLTNMSAILGNDVRSTNVLLDNYNAAATELNTSRDSVSGVDLNDEAMSLMTYQKSYAAACRLMTTLDEVLDKLINGTAI